ncbi:MAG: rRNA maturation RNase YbeY [Paracoccaceae bacterium]|nr:rRNA maturation RNase YbeY [Paracoccaceae bacterium]
MIEFINESKKWGKKKSVVIANQAVNSTLVHLNLDPDNFEIAILACDNEKIQELNSNFRGINKNTNILSWPEKDLSPKVSGTMPMKPEPINREPMFLGNLAISFEFIVKEAEKLNKDFYNHLYHLISHGTLHLLGFVHELELDAKIMENKEREILSKVGIVDPYGN